MTRREMEIYNLIKKDPLITQKEIAKRIGIKRSSVGVNIANLVKKGQIKGRGYILNEKDYAVVIGASNIDMVGISTNKIILEDSNPGKLKVSLGGVARNIAENLARLNVETKLLSAVGDDLHGDKVISESRKAGIDISDVYISSENRTSTYVSIVDDNGDMKLAIADMDISSDISIDYLEKNKKKILNAKVIIIDTNLDERVIEYIFNNYNNDNILVDTVSTTKSIKIKPFIGELHTIKPNKIEAEKLLDMKIENEDDMETAIEKFLDLGVSQVIISNGSKNIFYGDGEGIYKKEVKKVEMINSNGAGDAFMAGLVYSYIKGFNINKALDVSMEMSKLAIESEETISKLVSEVRILDNIKE